MEALGYNHHFAIQIALDGKAADILNEDYGQPDPNKFLLFTARQLYKCILSL